jgi:hypothetical protein
MPSYSILQKTEESNFNYSIHYACHATLLDTTTAITSSSTSTKTKIKDSDDDYIDAIQFNPSEESNFDDSIHYTHHATLLDTTTAIMSSSTPTKSKIKKKKHIKDSDYDNVDITTNESSKKSKQQR